MTDSSRQFSNTEFAYWLQGAIEIGTLTTLSNRQAACILKTLAHLREPMDSFAQLVRTTLLRLPDPADPLDLQTAFSAFYEALQAKFIHEVDPSYEGDQTFYHLVHQGLASPR